MPTFPRLSYVCPIAWAAMRGDERERFCAKCQRTVVNFSLLSETERLAQLEQERAKPGSVCVAYYQHLSGEFVTPENPLSALEARRALQIGATLALAAGLTLAANDPPGAARAAAAAHEQVESYCATVAVRTRDLVNTLAERAGLPVTPAPKPPLLILGMIACPAPPAAGAAPVPGSGGNGQVDQARI